MLVAITGSTGFLGRYIVSHLLAAGHTCRAWYRPGSDRSGFVNEGQNIEWIQGRLNDQGAAEALVHDADAVVHCALERQGGWSPSDQDLVDFVQSNVVGSLRLIQAARSAGVERFIFISTCAVHDVILDDRPLDEAHPLWPRSHYGAHKAAIEKFVHSFGLHGGVAPDGWDICALRPTGIYGIAQPVQQSRWYGLVRDVVEGKPINNPRGGKEVHAGDVAKAVGLLLAAKAGTTAGQSYNCYDMYVGAHDVAQIAKQCSGSASTIPNDCPRAKNQIDTSKLRALGMRFGGKPLLDQTVKELVHAVKGD